jgi:hypothetical protein
VRADANGLTVRSAIWGLKLKHIPMRDIEDVRVGSTRAMHWGGWGIRMRSGATAFVLRGDAALVIETSNGRLWSITMDNPAAAATVLHGWMAPQ